MEKTQIDKEDLKEIAAENIEFVLEKLEIEYTNRYNYLVGRCPIHNGTNETSFVYTVNKNMWACFSEGCHRKYGSDIIGLIQAKKQISFKEALDWLAKIFDIDDVKHNILDSEDKYLLKFKKKVAKQTNKKTYNKSCLEMLDKTHDYAAERGFLKTTQDEFGCGVATKNGMKNRLVFPVQDINGSIVGFSGRTIYEKCEKCKKYHKNGAHCRYGTPAKWKHSKDLQKSDLIFNLHRAKKSIKSTGELVIVEGIFDVMRLFEAGVMNSICLLGVFLDNKQIISLLSLGTIKKIYLCTDNDNAGANFKNKHTKYEDELYNAEKRELKDSILSRYFNVEKITFPDGIKDFGEMTTEVATTFCKEKGILH